MTLTLTPIDALPPRGERPHDETRPFTAKEKGPTSDYMPTVRAFAHGDAALAEVTYPPARIHPLTVVSGLRSAVRRGRYDDIHVLRRGDRVFLRRGLARPDALSRKDFTAAAAGTLQSFIASGKPTVSVIPPTGTDVSTLYNALSYRRTRGGYGDVRVSRDGETVRLTRV